MSYITTTLHIERDDGEILVHVGGDVTYAYGRYFPDVCETSIDLTPDETDLAADAIVDAVQDRGIRVDSGEWGV